MAPIPKAGPATLHNIRPIALLTTFYKLFAIIIRDRLQPLIDDFLYKTQFGFRNGRNTAQAIHLLRRTLEFAEQGGSELHLLFIEWTKAFDKLKHENIFEVLRRFTVPDTLIDQIRKMYAYPTYYTEMNGS